MWKIVYWISENVENFQSEKMDRAFSHHFPTKCSHLSGNSFSSIGFSSFKDGGIIY